jgi:RNA polymerase subunit RPABC4/transcription elongation factor Spt4
MDVGLVCDACSALTPIGVQQCTRCGAAVALDPRPRSAMASPAPTTGKPPGTLIPPAPAPGTASTSNGDPAACTKCGRQVGAGQRFCPHCGTRMPVPINFEVETRVGPRPSAVHNAVATQPHQVPGREPRESKPGRSTLFFGGAMQAARAKLTLIRGDGDDGVSFTLAGQDHLAGRGDCPISFPDDPFLSPIHANFVYANNHLVVRDHGSLNGVYVRISNATELVNGAMVLVGEQVLSVERAAQPEDRTARARTSRRAWSGRRRSRSARTCAAARSAGSTAPRARWSPSAARTTTSIFQTTRSSRVDTQSSNSPGTCYR